MGIVHRDVKPQNILFVTRRDRLIPWLIDFGISSRIQHSTTYTLTEQDNSSGTPAYMAPEQWLNQTQDGRTDQYSLGVLAYQLLSGRLPFSVTNPIALMGQIINMPAPPLTNIPPEVNSVVQRALSKTRKRRFSSCVEFVDALTGRKPSSSKAFAKALKEYLWPLLAGVLAFLMIGLFLFNTSSKRSEIAGPPSAEVESEDTATEENQPPVNAVPPTSRESFEWDGTKIRKFIGKETEVVIPEGTTEIGNYAFYDRSSLMSVVIPEGVTVIGGFAFYGCSSLTSVVIPKGVTVIGGYAFYCCSSLTSVTIPESVTEFGEGVFKKCPKLTIHASAG